MDARRGCVERHNRLSDRELEEIVIEILRLRAKFKNVRPDVVVLG
jgi:hypothetical protein